MNAQLVIERTSYGKGRENIALTKPSVTDESGKFITSSKFKCFKNARSSGRLKFSLNLFKSFLSLGNGGNVPFFGNT